MQQDCFASNPHTCTCTCQRAAATTTNTTGAALQLYSEAVPRTFMPLLHCPPCVCRPAAPDQRLRGVAPVPVPGHVLQHRWRRRGAPLRAALLRGRPCGAPRQGAAGHWKELLDGRWVAGAEVLVQYRAGAGRREDEGGWGGRRNRSLTVWGGNAARSWVGDGWCRRSLHSPQPAPSWPLHGSSGLQATCPYHAHEEPQVPRIAPRLPS